MNIEKKKKMLKIGNMSVFIVFDTDSNYIEAVFSDYSKALDYLRNYTDDLYTYCIYEKEVL